MSKSSVEFEEFKEAFTEYQKRFGLNGYKVYFKYESVEGSFATIIVNQRDMVATVTLNSNVPKKDIPFRDIKGNAKHEAIHLLIWKLYDRAKSRYVLEDELYEVNEELVRKLEGLIGDLKK
uniref:Peptidase n=1 Tax=viral metagenome TaxID=1070528 RepID=A0A6H1ZV90_9ZZZZ